MHQIRPLRDNAAPHTAGHFRFIYMPAIAFARTWGRVNPISAIRVSLLMRHSSLKKILGPLCLNRRWRFTLHRNSCQPGCCCYHIIQRGREVTRRGCGIPRRVVCSLRWTHHLRLIRRSGPWHDSPVYCHRVAGSCPWRTEEIHRIVIRQQARSMSPPEYFIRSILIHQKSIILGLNPLCLGI